MLQVLFKRVMITDVWDVFSFQANETAATGCHFQPATSCAPSVSFSCKAWPMGAPWYGLGFLLAGQCCGPPYMSAALAVSSQLLLSAARENRHLPPFPTPRRGLFKQISLMDFSAIKIAFQVPLSSPAVLDRNEHQESQELYKHRETQQNGIRKEMKFLKTNEK